MDDKKVKEKVAKTEQQLAEEFITKYRELCNKFGLQIVNTPIWMSRDDGTFSLVIKSSVSKLLPAS